MTTKTATASHWSHALCRLGACEEAVEWAETQPSYKSAWETCENGSWLLWLAGTLSGEQGSSAHRAVVLAACACARTALRFVPAGEDRPLTAIETAERWARGDRGATLDQVQAAEAAAGAAALKECADIVRRMVKRPRLGVKP